MKLGYSGFGGPVALVGYMHRDLVEKRKWISEEEYKEGWHSHSLLRVRLQHSWVFILALFTMDCFGATLAGLAFVLPSFIMVVIIGVAYKLFGGFALDASCFYGVGAAVIGIIGMSAYKLTTKNR